ncbi:pentatricopeptide repeat-containing protein chloroplastic-like [Gossypium australe]|uniref:Pentatricopeptide repeat-containing protein chloroplastic-like n=1 Tax=Gossypium australe TaxID=47621 RepID=A0A5B6VT05_9ROSI|nr:pentatricopeptide repeat-containing protein chloroplastic-like [Gossypium australe]
MNLCRSVSFEETMLGSFRFFNMVLYGDSLLSHGQGLDRVQGRVVWKSALLFKLRSVYLKSAECWIAYLDCSTLEDIAYLKRDFFICIQLFWGLFRFSSCGSGSSLKCVVHSSNLSTLRLRSSYNSSLLAQEKKSFNQKRILGEKETLSKSLYKDPKYDLEEGGQLGSQLSQKPSQKIPEGDETYDESCALASIVVIVSLQTFYNGVNSSTRQMIDSSAGGALNNKTPKAAYDFIEEMSLNNYQWQITRAKLTKSVSAFNIDTVTMLSTHVEMMNKKLDNLCRRNHPNFSWGGQGNQGNQRKQPPPNYQNQPYPQEKKSNLEEMLKKFMAAIDSHFQKTETTLSEQQASIKGIENQVRRLTQTVGELTRSVGHLMKLIFELSKDVYQATKKLT